MRNHLWRMNPPWHCPRVPWSVRCVSVHQLVITSPPQGEPPWWWDPQAGPFLHYGNWLHSSALCFFSRPTTPRGGGKNVVIESPVKSLCLWNYPQHPVGEASRWSTDARRSKGHVKVRSHVLRRLHAQTCVCYLSIYLEKHKDRFVMEDSVSDQG